jgi:hypothetical protein
MQEIETKVDVERGTPGYYVWTVSRATVLRYGEHVANLSAECAEDYALTFINRDAADSKSDFSLVDNRRVAGPDGALDPIEQFERENATAVPSTTSPGSDHERTDAPGVALGLLATVAAAVLARRRA